MLAVVEIPEHGDPILSAGGGEGAIGGDGESVDVASVAEVVRLQLALVQFPDLASTSAESPWRRHCDGRERRRDQRSWWKILSHWGDNPLK